MIHHSFYKPWILNLTEYQRSTESDCKDIKIRKIEFEASTSPNLAASEEKSKDVTSCKL